MSQLKVLLILASKSNLANNRKSKRRYTCRTGRIENRKERDEIIEESAVMKDIVQF